MNSKKCKALRKAVASIKYSPPEVKVKEHIALDALGVPYKYGIVQPMFYPEGSRRRIYKDAKRFGFFV